MTKFGNSQRVAGATMTPEPHPLRCETCNQTILGKCPATNVCANSINDTRAIYKVTEIIGCASHSSATTSAEQVLDELIPSAKGEAKSSGWRVDPPFLQRVETRANNEEYMSETHFCLEEIECVLIALLAELRSQRGREPG